MNTITKIGNIEFNKALMENMARTTEGVWVVDVAEEKIYILHNMLVPELQGKELLLAEFLDEIIGKSSPEGAEILKKNFNIERLSSLKNTEEFVSEGIDSEGMPVILKGVETPEFDEDGNVKFVYISFISQQDKVELKEKADELDKYLKAVTCGIIQYEKDTNNIIYVNENALKLLGYSTVEELQGFGFNGVANTVYPEDAEMMNELFQSLSTEDDRVEYEYRVKHFDGKDVICYGTAQIFIDEEGRVVVQRSMIDITESRMFAAEVEKTQQEIEQAKQQKKEIEEALIQAERANRSKSLFLGNMSQEIRTPMNAIISYTALGLTNIDDQQKVKDSLRKIQVASSHLLSIINDVLDKSMIDSGEMELKEAPMSLNAIINNIYNIAKADAHRKSIAFTCDCNVKNDNVIGDKARFNQIIINCISNALKFTKENGEITLKLTELESESEDMGKYELRIKDTGIGMSEEFAAHIFDPFSRENSDIMTTGTGLGMTITSNLVNIMNGTIDVETAPGKGTEFTIVIPLKIVTENV